MLFRSSNQRSDELGESAMKTNTPGSRSRLPTIVVSFLAGWVVAFPCCLFLLIMLNMLDGLSSAHNRRETDEIGRASCRERV